MVLDDQIHLMVDSRERSRYPVDDYFKHLEYRIVHVEVLYKPSSFFLQRPCTLPLSASIIAADHVLLVLSSVSSFSMSLTIP
jgi:hypothetical protein